MQSQPIKVDKLFTKWFVRDKGQNQVPDFYAHDLWNVRIKNFGITQRDWQKTIYTAAWDPVQFIEYVNGELIIAQNGTVSKVNVANDPVDLTSIGSITITTQCNTLVYGKYLIILTGVGYPRVYDGSSLTQLTSTVIANGTNPSFWASFTGFTIINSALNKNTVRISRPILPDTQVYCYDWVGSGAESAPFDSEVLALCKSLSSLWIFTRRSIEYIDKTTITNVWGISSIYSVPLWDWYEVVNSNSVVSAGDIIFFATKNKKIGTVKYRSNITTPWIDIISDNPVNSIDWYLQNLNFDKCRLSFDRKNNLVKIALRTETSLYNDIEVIYDIDNETWLKDDNKYIRDRAVDWDISYFASDISFTIKEDETGSDDDWQEINMYYETQDMTLWEPALVKQYRGSILAGQESSISVINQKIFVDSVKVHEKNINWSDRSPLLALWIGGSDVWWSPLGWEIWTINDLVDFEDVIWPVWLRTSWKKIKYIRSAQVAWQNVLIDSLSIMAVPRKRYRIWDKI